MNTTRRRASATGLDPLLTDPTRLSIVAVLAGADRAEFRFVADKADLSDSALSKQASMLGRNGILEIHKGYVGNRPRTWYSLTDDGRRRLRAHIAALRNIAEQATRPHNEWPQ
jgi:DNA-binding transcriptional ArsR family regulator